MDNKGFLVISTNTELVRINVRHIVYITSDGNYSYIHQTGGESRMVSAQLGQIEEDILPKQLPAELNGLFIRIGRNLIINTNYIHYINTQRQQIVLVDAFQNQHSLTASKDALKQLKEAINEKGGLQ